MDLIIAFWNGFIDRYNIFVEQLLAYKVGINPIHKLLKVLYILKQSLKIWYQVLYKSYISKSLLEPK